MFSDTLKFFFKFEFNECKLQTVLLEKILNPSLILNFKFKFAQ